MIELIERWHGNDYFDLHYTDKWMLYIPKVDLGMEKHTKRFKIMHFSDYFHTKTGKVVGYGLKGSLRALKRILRGQNYIIIPCPKE